MLGWRRDGDARHDGRSGRGRRSLLSGERCGANLSLHNRFSKWLVAVPSSIDAHPPFNAIFEAIMEYQGKPKPIVNALANKIGAERADDDMS